MATEFKRLGVDVDSDAARALVEIVGDDVLMLESEIEKIATWASGRTVGAGEVEALAVPAREAEAWALTDAWGARDLPGAMAACEASLALREPFALAVALASHVGRVRGAQALAEEGLGSTRDRKEARDQGVPGPQGAWPTPRTTRVPSSTRRSSDWPSWMRRSRGRVACPPSSSWSGRSPT